MKRNWLIGRLGPAGWFCLAIILVFGIRAGTTLAGGADWTLPSTGLRSVWQIAMVLLAIAGLIFQIRIRWFVGIIGLVYLAATVLELFDGTSLFGVIPVDMRDRIIHPLVALLAAAVIAIVNRVRMRRPSRAAAAG